MTDATPAIDPLATDPIQLKIDGKDRVFNIDDPVLPDWIGKKALKSASYPYNHKMPGTDYDQQLQNLQLELVKMAAWIAESGARALVLFEGRDAAGKGGTISVLHEVLNPRTARNVALAKPTDFEKGHWYYQRYIQRFPGAGEFVSFDRSWYNRAVVEPVLGFCTPEQNAKFLEETPRFERLLVDDGIHFIKMWLDIGQEMQLKRFHDRRHDPLKSWKFSPIDVQGITRWKDYTAKRDEMLQRTHSDAAPWTVVAANDKRRARLAVIRRLLLSIPYAGRDLAAVGPEDDAIISGAPRFLKKRKRND